MGFRVAAPDGQKGKDGRTMLVLPENTVLRRKYTVRYLTAGGMSIAYLGEREGKTYFVKEVETGDARRMVSISQEKLMLEQLDHPGIIKVFDFFEEDGFYYLVSEYIEGPSLEKLISPKTGIFIKESVILEWASQLCDIFEYLHHLKPPVIYRDLKPQNIIRDREGRLHLVDFGIARIFKTSKEEDTEPMGTALTASPEHFGGTQTDERSDIFTLGATLHFLATNGLGFSCQLFEFEPARTVNAKISEHFEKVLKKCTDFDPANRYQNISELRAALFNHNGESVKEPKAIAAETPKIPEASPPPPSQDILKKTLAPAVSFFNICKPYVTVALIVFLIALTVIVLINASAPRKALTDRTLSTSSAVVSDDSTPHEEISLLPTESSSPACATPSPTVTGTGASSTQPFVLLVEAASSPSVVSSSPVGAATAAVPAAATPASGYPQAKPPEKKNTDTTVVATPLPSPPVPANLTKTEYLARVIKMKPSDLSRIDSVSCKDLFPIGNDSGYKINLPREYLTFKMVKPFFNSSERTFAAIDPEKGEKTLRFLTITPVAHRQVDKDDHVVMWNSMDEYMRQSLQNHTVNRIEELHDTEKHIKYKRGLEYTFTLQPYAAGTLPFTLRCEQIIYTVKDPSNCYALTVAAHPDYFRDYEREFREFFENSPSVTDALNP
ncbi:MAG: serine/threonine protein kinase [Candidatus Xenobiia bacterium LiM19]